MATSIVRHGQFDSRDVIRRIEELRDELEGLENETRIAKLEGSGRTEEIEEINELKKELESLLALEEIGQNATSEWRDGATFVREEHFAGYAEELCRELGYLKDDHPSWIEIDWAATVNNLKMDYTKIDWEGDTYYVGL